MSVDVQVERPVTIKASGKTIKLTDEEARELVRKLNDVLGIKAAPWIPWYPYTYTPSSPEVHITGDLSGLASSTDSVVMGTYSSLEVA